jgi:hypothetical protein
MERLKPWCEASVSADEFERRLEEAGRSDEVADALLADELLPLWRRARAGQALPF